MEKIEIPAVPLLRHALLCVTRLGPKAWLAPEGPAGHLMAGDLPHFASIAATLCSGGECFFCGAPQEEMSPEKVGVFHADYKLCPCLAEYTQEAMDFVRHWDTDEVFKDLVTGYTDGRINGDTPVYQFQCRGCRTCVMVRAEAAVGLAHGRAAKAGGPVKPIRENTCWRCRHRWKTKRAEGRGNGPAYQGKARNGPLGAKMKGLEKLEGREVAPATPAAANAVDPAFLESLTPGALEVTLSAAPTEYHVAAQATDPELQAQQPAPAQSRRDDRRHKRGGRNRGNNPGAPKAPVAPQTAEAQPAVKEEQSLLDAAAAFIRIIRAPRG